MKRFIGVVVAMVLAGCSTGKDAASGYVPKLAGGPGGAPTPGPGPVNVQVFDDVGKPAAGMPVIFNHADGQILSQEQTSDVGQASAAIPLDATVTVFRDQPSLHYLQSVAGLHGGMTVVAGSAAPAAAPATAQVTLPGAFSGAMTYEVDSGCGQGFTQTGTDTVAVALDGSCPAGGTVSLIAVARDSGWTPVAFAFLTDLTVPASGTLDATLGAWRSDFVNVPFSLTGAPTGSASVSADLDLWRNGRRYQFGSAYAQLAAGQDAALTIAIPGDFGDATSYSVTLTFDNGTSGSFLERRAAVLPGSVAVDLSTDLLPRTVVTGVDVSDPSRPVVSWTSDAPISANAATVSTQWSSADGSNTWIWNALTPATVHSLQMPSVPDTLVNAHPAADATLVTAGVQVMALDFVNGYDEVAGASAWSPTSSADYTLRTGWASL